MGTLEKLGQVYLEALKEVIATVTGIHLNVGSREPNIDFNEITGVMCLNGKRNGLLFVTANADDVKTMCSHFIGVTPEEVTSDDLDDTMCEIVNMTAGSAKLRLGGSEYMFSLLQPFVIKGKDVSIITKSITAVEAGTLTNGDISVDYKIVY